MARTSDDGSRLARTISGVIICLAGPLGVSYLLLGLGAAWLGLLYMPVPFLVDVRWVALKQVSERLI